MTREKAIELFPVIKAWVEGKAIQYKDIDKWSDVLPSESLTLEDLPSYYRIKPEPKLRPWRPEEVPVGKALIRYRDADVWHLIIGIEHNTIMAGRGFVCNIESAVNYEHSLDHGKTWQPCGVLE